ncbi:MAG TPA: hypothetical protein VF250_11495 [Conexibacter sp.]
MLLAVACAIVCLGTLVSTATARNFSTTSQTWRATYRSLEIRRIAEVEAVRCPLTIEGSFHSRTFAKSVGALIGYITRAVVGTCEFGSATILPLTLPWHIQYASFSGILGARITSIRANMVNFGMNVREAFTTCLFRSTATEPVAWTLSFPFGIVSGNLEGEIANTAGECFFETTRVTGASTSIGVLNAATRITITLI